MCSIVSYRVEKDELRHPFLVEEESLEYGVSRVENPRDAVDILNDVFRMKHLAEEMVCMISMDTKGKVLGLFKVSQGSINNSTCTPREIYLRALVSGAASIIVVHNHPSGDPLPSEMDMIVCERLVSAGRLMGIPVQDFIIIGDTYYSFKEKEEWSLS